MAATILWRLKPRPGLQSLLRRLRTVHRKIFTHLFLVLACFSPTGAATLLRVYEARE